MMISGSQERRSGLFRIRLQGEPGLCLPIQLDSSGSSSKSLYMDLLDKIQRSVKVRVQKLLASKFRQILIIGAELEY